LGLPRQHRFHPQSLDVNFTILTKTLPPCDAGGGFFF